MGRKTLMLMKRNTKRIGRNMVCKINEVKTLKISMTFSFLVFHFHMLHNAVYAVIFTFKEMISHMMHLTYQLQDKTPRNSEHDFIKCQQ
jgi:hypothetical protein